MHAVPFARARLVGYDSDAREKLPRHPPPLSADEHALRNELKAEVQQIAGDIGERNLSHYPKLQAAALYIESELIKAGWKVRRDE